MEIFTNTFHESDSERLAIAGIGLPAGIDVSWQHRKTHAFHFGQIEVRWGKPGSLSAHVDLLS